MRIAFDHKIFSQQKYGGPSRYFLKLFENINSLEDNEAFIVSPIYNNAYLLKSKFKKNIHGIRIPKIKYFGLFNNLINNTRSKKIINNLKCQILHTTDYSTLNSDCIRPLVVTVHDLIHEIFYKEFDKLEDFRPKKEILKKADHIICVSENTKKDLIKYYPIDEKKISVIYHGTSFSKSEFIPSSIKFIKPKYKYFLYIGSRKRYKNFYKIIKAFKKRKEIYENYKLVCFGGGPLLASEKERLIKDNFDINKIILYPKNHDEILYELYKNAVALIYPSLYEGFGMPIIEAMSLGCPVIASNTSSLPEICDNNALSFSPYSEDELLDKMTDIINDKDLKNKIINSGLEHSSNFTWEKCTKETLSVYNRLI